MIMCELVADPARGGLRARNPARMVPGLPARRCRRDQRTGRARRARRIHAPVVTVDSQVVAESRELRRAPVSLRRCGPACASPGKASRIRAGCSARSCGRCCKHGMPHFENNYAPRGAPILSPNVMRDLVRPRPSRLDALRADPRAWKGRWSSRASCIADDARRARDAGADGDHPVEPWRPPARRRGRAAARAAGHRRGVPRLSR